MVEVKVDPPTSAPRHSNRASDQQTRSRGPRPLFSIITVVMNDVQGFMDTRASVAALSEESYEWIVVDGQSNDGLPEYLRRGDALVTRWVSEPDLGIYDAMNKGVTLARGQYVVFMNAGDRFKDPESLTYVRELVVAEEMKPDVVFGGAQLVFANGLAFYRSPRRAERTIWHGLPANHQATYYLRSWLRELPYDLSFYVCGDYYLIASLMRRGAHAAYLNRPLVRFRAGGTSLQRKSDLLTEPYRIQRDILHEPWWLRAVSFFRRLVATSLISGIEALPRVTRRGGGN